MQQKVDVIKCLQKPVGVVTTVLSYLCQTYHRWLETALSGKSHNKQLAGLSKSLLQRGKGD